MLLNRKHFLANHLHSSVMSPIRGDRKFFIYPTYPVSPQLVLLDGPVKLHIFLNVSCDDASAWLTYIRSNPSWPQSSSLVNVLGLEFTSSQSISEKPCPNNTHASSEVIFGFWSICLEWVRLEPSTDVNTSRLHKNKTSKKEVMSNCMQYIPLQLAFKLSDDTATTLCQIRNLAKGLLDFEINHLQSMINFTCVCVLSANTALNTAKCHKTAHC